MLESLDIIAACPRFRFCAMKPTAPKKRSGVSPSTGVLKSRFSQNPKRQLFQNPKRQLFHNPKRHGVLI
ncbi:MAG: hypothetical protein ACF8AM_05540 [Rhodopirellula sp. JB055]|uniref:hypothetical protein n=1 Tax=Rhodopirellula sp. JB055 TaxID=3342846 RepID=UPI00370A9ECB